LAKSSNIGVTIALESGAYVQNEIFHFFFPYHIQWQMDILITKKQFSNFDGHYHYLLDSHIYDATSIDDNICNDDDDYLKKDMIIR